MKLIKNAIAFGFGTSISRLLGFFREIIFAYLFGAGFCMDAFRVAFRIPNLLRDIIAEGSVTPAFLPTFSDMYKKDRKATVNFINEFTGAMLLITLLITLIGIIFAPLFVKIIAPGFVKVEKTFILTTKLTRIIFPFIIFISLYSIGLGVLNFLSHFFITGIASCWFNIIIIAFAFLFHKKLNITAVGIGVVIGGLFQMAAQFPTLYKEGYIGVPKIKFTREVKRVFKYMLPIIIGYSTNKITTIIVTLIASFLREGVISWLGYAFILKYLPVAIIGVAITNAVLPMASKSLSEKKFNEFKKIINQATLYSLVFSIPIILLLILFAIPICRIIYERGAFTSYDTINTAIILQFYSPSILGLILSKVFATAFYTLKDTKTPMKISFIVVIINTILAIALTKMMDFKGIPLSVSISDLLNALLLYILLRKKLLDIYKNMDILKNEKKF